MADWSYPVSMDAYTLEDPTVLDPGDVLHDMIPVRKNIGEIAKKAIRICGWTILRPNNSPPPEITGGFLQGN